MSAIYKAKATATGGREGNVKSSDGVLNLDLAFPREMGGSGAAKTNPEQLFAAGYAACFHSALKLVAGKMKLPAASSTVTAEVGIGPDATSFALEVALQVSMPGVPDAAATEVVKAAHQVCPYSKATRGNIPATLVLIGEDGSLKPIA